MGCRDNFQVIVWCMLVAFCVFPLDVGAQGSQDAEGPAKIGGKSHETGMSDGIVKDENGAYYIIKKGDTLWGLSQRFLKSPWYWPALWAHNSDAPIRNPHDIYPGQRIRLRPRQLPLEISGDSWQEEAGTPAISPLTEGPTNRDNPFPALSKQVAMPPPKQDGKKNHFLCPLINGVGFLRRRLVDPSGSIFKVKDDKEMISKGDEVYVREIERDSLIIGRHYTVYRTLKPLKDDEERTIGIQHIPTGIVEIVSIHPRFAIGKVIQSFRDIAINDLLMPHQPRSPKIPLAKSVEGLRGKIIMSENHGAIMGEHNIAFIDKGEKDGVAPGQQYSIYYQEKARLNPESDMETPLPPVDFGRLIVLRTERSVSTVLIIQSDKAIHPGTRIRSPM